MVDSSQLTSYARLLRLTPITEVAMVAPEVSLVTEERPHRNRRAWGALSFFVLVVFPVCLAAGYLGLIAVDRYESEARFVLRTPNSGTPDIAMPKLLQSVSPARPTDDGYVVKEFLESRDAMMWLVKTAGLKEAYGKGGSDFVWTFPNILSSETNESLYRHYQRMMSATFDSATGINALKVQAFTPTDAERLTTSLLDAAQALVNRLNERARSDAIQLADAEVDRMRRRVLAAQTALMEFRDRERLIDPAQSTLAVVESIGNLSTQIAIVGVQINELSKSAPESPQIGSLRGRQAALEDQILVERQRLAGDAKSIAPRMAEYERLVLDREFAHQALMAAMTALETSRVDAVRQHIYLERVSSPARPDYPAYPDRLLWLLGIAAAAYMMWRIWRVLVADVLGHVDPQGQQ